MSDQERLSQPQPTGPETSPPLGESPWFWILLFSLVATIALSMMHHRYSARQQAIERKFFAREHVARQAREGRPASPQLPPQLAPGTALVIPLWPLALLFALLAAAAAMMLYREISRRRESSRSL